MLIHFMFSYFILYFPQSDFLVFKTVDYIPIIIYHIIRIFPLFIYWGLGFRTCNSEFITFYDGN